MLFGTLGEAQSFSLDERRDALEALLSTVEAQRVMVGIGAAALSDAVALARHAAGDGCLRQLLLPPFFFKGVSEEGVYRFVAEDHRPRRRPA